MRPHTKAFLGGQVTELSQFSIYAVDSMWVDSDGEKKWGPIHRTIFEQMSSAGDRTTFSIFSLKIKHFYCHIIFDSAWKMDLMSSNIGQWFMRELIWFSKDIANFLLLYNPASLCVKH